MGQHDTTRNALLGFTNLRKITTPEGTVRIPEVSLSALTKGERLLIWRRREGHTQREAAKLLGMGMKRYTHIERGERRDELPARTSLFGELQSHEICFLLRRASGRTIPECAAEAGVSRYWYNLMEQGKVCSDRLFKYWGEDGRQQQSRHRLPEEV